MWMYTKKIEEKNEQTKEKYRLVYMQMDWIAKVFTGEDTKLMNEFENNIDNNMPVREDGDRTLEQRIKDEEEMLAGLDSIGFKVK